MADDELQSFQLMIGSKGGYAYWVTKYAVRGAQWVKAASGALDASVLAHPEMARLSQVHSACSFIGDATSNVVVVVFSTLPLCLPFRLFCEVVLEVSFKSDLHKTLSQSWCHSKHEVKEIRRRRVPLFRKGCPRSRLPRTLIPHRNPLQVSILFVSRRMICTTRRGISGA